MPQRFDLFEVNESEKKRILEINNLTEQSKWSKFWDKFVGYKQGSFKMTPLGIQTYGKLGIPATFNIMFDQKWPTKISAYVSNNKANTAKFYNDRLQIGTVTQGGRFDTNAWHKFNEVKIGATDVNGMFTITSLSKT
jgi:hypothetical protein